MLTAPYLPLGAAALCAACASTAVDGHTSTHGSKGVLPPELVQAVDALYLAFDFEPGAQPDWDAMRALFAADATFAYPIAVGAPARLMDGEAFLAAFKGWVDTPNAQATGFFERVLEVEGRAVGRVAHTWVLFEGYAPGSGEVLSRGLDSIAWVHDAGAWKVASFTSQYTEPGLDF